MRNYAHLVGLNNKTLRRGRMNYKDTEPYMSVFL